MKLEFSRLVFKKKKNPKIKFYENLFSGGRVVPCGQTDGGMDMKKLIVACHNFSNAPKTAGTHTKDTHGTTSKAVFRC